MVHISMCRPGTSWRDHVNPPTYPIIAPYPVGLGQLMHHNVLRMPEDPVWLVETIGM